MAQRKRYIGKWTEGLVPCPNCHDGFDVVPTKAGQDGPCRVCEGRMFVNPEHLCVCGRPGFHEETGVYFCGRLDCVKEAKTAKLL